MSNDKVAATSYAGLPVHLHLEDGSMLCGVPETGQGRISTTSKLSVTCQFCIGVIHHQMTHDEALSMLGEFEDRYPAYNRFVARYGRYGHDLTPEEASRYDKADELVSEALHDGLPIEDQAPVPGPTGKQLLIALGIMALIVLLVSLPGILGRW